MELWHIIEFGDVGKCFLLDLWLNFNFRYMRIDNRSSYLFNKQVVLGFRNPDPFTKQVVFYLTRHELNTRTWIATPKYIENSLWVVNITYRDTLKYKRTKSSNRYMFNYVILTIYSSHHYLMWNFTHTCTPSTKNKFEIMFLCMITNKELRKCIS